MKNIPIHYLMLCLIAPLSSSSSAAETPLQNKIKTALAATELSDNKIKPGQYVLITLSTKVTETFTTGRPPLDYTYSGTVAVPLDGLSRATLVKYKCGIPSVRPTGEFFKTTWDRGVARFENGVWKDFAVDNLSGDDVIPVKKFKVSEPGYENVESLPGNVIHYSPLRFMFSDDPRSLRIGFEESGMKGLLGFAAKTGSIPGLTVDAGKEAKNLIVITQGQPEGGSRQTTVYDLEKGLSPIRMTYTGATDSGRSLDEWTTKGHVHLEGFGWIPRSVEGERTEEGTFSTKFKMSVESVEMIDHDAATKLFKKEIGPGWSVEDKQIGESFKLDTPSN